MCTITLTDDMIIRCLLNGGMVYVRSDWDRKTKKGGAEDKTDKHKALPIHRRGWVFLLDCVWSKIARRMIIGVTKLYYYYYYYYENLQKYLLYILGPSAVTSTVSCRTRPPNKFAHVVRAVALSWRSAKWLTVVKTECDTTTNSPHKHCIRMRPILVI